MQNYKHYQQVGPSQACSTINSEQPKIIRKCYVHLQNYSVQNRIGMWECLNVVVVVLLPTGIIFVYFLYSMSGQAVLWLSTIIRLDALNDGCHSENAEVQKLKHENQTVKVRKKAAYWCHSCVCWDLVAKGDCLLAMWEPNPGILDCRKHRYQECCHGEYKVARPTPRLTQPCWLFCSNDADVSVVIVTCWESSSVFRDSQLDHTHLIVSFQWSGFSNQQLLLLTA